MGMRLIIRRIPIFFMSWDSHLLTSEGLYVKIKFLMSFYKIIKFILDESSLGLYNVFRW